MLHVCELILWTNKDYLPVLPTLPVDMYMYSTYINLFCFPW